MLQILPGRVAPHLEARNNAHCTRHWKSALHAALEISFRMVSQKGLRRQVAPRSIYAIAMLSMAQRHLLLGQRFAFASSQVFRFSKPHCIFSNDIAPEGSLLNVLPGDWRKRSETNSNLSTTEG